MIDVRDNRDIAEIHVGSAFCLWCVRGLSPREAKDQSLLSRMRLKDVKQLDRWRFAAQGGRSLLALYRQASDLTHKMRQSFSDGLFVAQAVAGSDG